MSHILLCLIYNLAYHKYEKWQNWMDELQQHHKK